MSDILIIDENNKKSQQKESRKPERKSARNKLDELNDFFIGLQKVKTKDKVIFYRLLATMTNAGMSILKSVSVLEKQEKNPILKKMLQTFVVELRSGKNFSECLELFPNTFEEAEVGIVKSGEKTGQLNDVLRDLAMQIEKVESISWKIKSAMIYPFCIILVVIWVIAVMLIVVVPKLLEIFQGKWELPPATTLLINISDTLRDYWPFILVCMVLIYVFVAIWKKTPTGHYLYDGLILKVPVFGEINKKLILSKFARIFSGLLWSWVSVVECLKITSVAVWNEVYKQRLILLASDVQQWIKIWESLDGDKMFPDMMVQMIQVWEQTAKLDKTVIKIADFYDEQVDNTIGVLNKLLEPFIIVFLALVVWFIAVATMQPIMNMADTIAN